MKHATEDTLRSMSSFLDQIRDVPALREKKLGVFYRNSRAFLHFHEGPAGVYADVRLKGSDFDRLPVNTADQRQKVLDAIRGKSVG